MTNTTRIFVALFALGSLATVLTFAASSAPSGESIYKQHCAMCHRVDGKGFPAMKSPDFTDPKWQASVKDKELLEVIKNGKKGTAMPGFGDKLKANEIEAVTKYIRSFNSKKK